MRLLFCMSNFPPSQFGGIASSMFSVVKVLNQNFDVKVLTTNYKLPDNSITNSWTSFEGIKVKYINTLIPAMSPRYLIEGIIQIYKCDQVHLSSIFFFPNAIFALFSLLFNKKLSIAPHGELFSAALNQKKWKKKPYLLLLRYIIAESKFRATSNTEKESIIKIFPKAKVQIIPNIHILERHNSTRKNQFIFLGRICSIKKIENLIIGCSLSKLIRSQEYQFIIVGPVDNGFKSYFKLLNELILRENLQEIVKFRGEIMSKNKDIILAESKALFLVSDSENFGNVVVEALAQGTIVVASKGTPWKSLESNACGFWIDNSPQVIAETIDKIIGMDSIEQTTMSNNAYEFSKEFNQEKISPQWLNYIYKLRDDDF